MPAAALIRWHGCATAVAATMVSMHVPAADAQVSGSIDAGASWVDYEGFLASGAGYLSPTVRYDARDLSLGASGTVLVFESGNQVFQGLTAAAWRVRLGTGISTELAGSAGFNGYSATPAYHHLVVGGRLHAGDVRKGAWLGGSTGQSSNGTTTLTLREIEAGLWLVARGLALRSMARQTWVTGGNYLDITGFGRWTDGDLLIEGSMGVRARSDGAGRGVYGELQLQVPITGRFSALVSGGRYPTNPARGVLAANYVSTAIRYNWAVPRSTVPSGPHTTSPRVGEAAMRLVASRPPMYTIRVEAPQALAVEIVGDFTDWQPVTLARGGGSWEVTVSIPPGVYRVNVRIDGGPWIAPLGLRIEEDEYGMRVGVLVVGR